MKELSATEAARNFSEVLDAVERDHEEFVVVRRGKPVARLSPATRSNGGALKSFLRSHKPDADWTHDLKDLRDSLRIEERPWRD